MLVREVQGGGVDEGEGEDLRGSVSVDIEVDVDRRGANVGCMGAAPLDELCDGSELVLCSCGGYVAGVEEETEEGRLAGALASDHEGVASVGGLQVEEGWTGGAHAIGGIVGCKGDGGGGRGDVFAVVVGGVDALVAAVLDDERHG